MLRSSEIVEKLHEYLDYSTSKIIGFSFSDQNDAKELLEAIKKENISSFSRIKIIKNGNEYTFELTGQQYEQLIKKLGFDFDLIDNPKPISYQEQMEFIDFYINHQHQLKSQEDFFEQNPGFAKFNSRVKAILSMEHEHFVSFDPEFVAIVQNHITDNLKIGYLPNKTVENVEERNLFQLAPVPQQALYRQYTRHRVIFGPVNFYFQDSNPVRLNVITACGPNLMGSSRQDSALYLKNKKLDRDIYQLSCKKVANLIVKTAKEQGHSRLIMPGFGVGAYIKSLGKKDKKVAIQIMYTAFLNAASEHRLKVDWIIWSKGVKPLKKLDLLNTINSNNPYITNIVHDDILSYAIKSQSDGERCVVLNPGSDRTVGGEYTLHDPKTVEEQFAQKSDLILLQSVYNRKLTDNLIEKITRLNQTSLKKSSSEEFILIEKDLEENFEDSEKSNFRQNGSVFFKVPKLRVEESYAVSTALRLKDLW